MKTILNLTLLLVGTAATLSAFGGKTWREGREQILKRVTSRGWVSLVCLVLAFALGIKKEFMSHNEEIKQTEANRKIENEADKREESLRRQLANATTRLEDLRLLNSSMSDHLADAQKTIDNVRQSLNVTRDQLTQATTSTLLSTIANSEVKLKSVRFFLPFTAKAHSSANFAEAFLPSFDLNVCKDLIGATVYVVTQEGSGQTFHYALSDEHVEHKSRDKADWIFQSSGDDGRRFKIAVAEMKQASSNGLIYVAEAASNVPAGELLTRLIGTNEVVAQISFQWPADGPADEPIGKWKELTDRYRSFFNPPANRQNDIWRTDINAVPKSCSDEIGRYFKLAFEKAAISLRLAQKQNEEVVFVLKAGRPFFWRRGWRVAFTPETHIPQILVVGANSSLLENSQ